MTVFNIAVTDTYNCVWYHLLFTLETLEMNKGPSYTRTSTKFKNSHSSALNVGQSLQAYASNFHEP